MSKRKTPSASSGEAKKGKAFVDLPPLDVSIGSFTVRGYGMGTLPLGIMYPDPSARPDSQTAIQILKTAVEAGVQLIDTADTYCEDGNSLHYVENIIKQCKFDTDNVVIATKGGMGRAKNNNTNRSWVPIRVTPTTVKDIIRRSAEALGGHIQLWQLHHPNPKTVGKIMKAAAEMKEEGLVSEIGVCNATCADIDAIIAAGVHIVSVQNKFSFWFRQAAKALPAKKIGKTNVSGTLDKCAELGIPFMAYAALGGVEARDGRKSLLTDPKCAGLRKAAKEKGVSVHALLLSLMRHKWPHIVHITSARSVAHASIAKEAATIRFTQNELDTLW